eukprot:Sspe_Gene.37518::Locus_18108_Transcript_1_1_Confidence_1.000_Length_2428::g.37518::m.37518/K11593/ELF2C, AGO; eukaryotic translation initiation factor 2C
MNGGEINTERSSSWNFNIDQHPKTQPFFGLHHPPQRVLLVYPVQAERDIEDFSGRLSRTLEYFAGGKRPDVKMVDVQRFRKDDVAEVFKKFGDKPDCYIFIADQRSPAYETVKMDGHIRHGVPTQVVELRTIRPVKPAVVNKIATQILTKCGNAAWAVKGFTLPNTMVGGVAFHSAGSQMERKEKKQVASICCTVDPDLSRFCCEREQTKSQHDWATDVSRPFTRLLKKYTKLNGGAPLKRVVLFRQGGSEGEIPHIMDTEVANIREAIQKATGSATTELVFILVLRQSHLRMRVPQTMDNAPWGTVLDRYVVAPTGIEFFLLSHSCNLGSATGVQYKVLCNDSKMSSEEL